MKTVKIEEAVMANTYSLEAIMRLLIEKGILTQDEFLVKLKELKTEVRRN